MAFKNCPNCPTTAKCREAGKCLMKSYSGKKMGKDKTTPAGKDYS